MNKAQFTAQFRLNRMAKKNVSKNIPLKSAAVLIPLVARNNQLSMLLTQRSLHLRHHPGQVSFPGGRFEKQDNKLVTTALRETQEEIGIAANQVEVIGHMGHYQTISNYKVTPYIGFVDPNYQLDIDHNEVKEVFEVPWPFFLERQNHHPVDVMRKGVNHRVHFMPFNNKMIWGTTALIIHDLVKHFEHN